MASTSRSVSALRCRECGDRVPATAVSVCAECFGPLEAVYDAPRLTRAEVEAGPPSIWRYAPLLPSAPAPGDLGAGLTRLVRARNLGAALGIDELWVKDDSGNPTHSFKDRVVSVALGKAVELGCDVLACASTGNLAQSVAAHAARAGLRSVVLVPADLEPGKVVPTAVYGAEVVGVDGTYDDANRLCAELSAERPSWAFVNVNLRAYYAEGSKTLGYEVAEQLGWRLPGQVVVPVASGSLLTKVDKAFRELAALGLVDEAPYAVFGAQAAGCSPVATAYDNGWDVPRPVRRPDTVAKSLAIGSPADGPYALEVVRRTGGAVAAATDEEVVAGIRLLAETEGVFAETAGGVAVATLRRLVREGRLRTDVPTVLLNTGEGLKTLDAVDAGFSRTIAPTLAAFRGEVAA